MLIKIKGNSWLIRIFAIVLGGLLVLTSGCSLLPEEEEALRPPLVKPAKQSYETTDVKKATIIKQVKSVATFEPTDIAYHELKESGGKVAEVLVKSGDTVKKGDLLVQLEMEGLDLELKYKRLEVAKAEVELDKAKEVRDEKNMIVKLMELDIAKSEVELTQRKLRGKQLLAKMDGQVIFVEEMKPGDAVDPYHVLVSVADVHQLRLTFQPVNDADMKEVKVGMKADVDFNSKKYVAKVVQTPSSAPLTTNKELQERYAKTLYVELNKVPDTAQIGDVADVSIITQQKNDTLIIPRSALRSYMGRNYVQILDGESRKEVDVEVGIKTGTEVEILQGVKEGQKVILQ